MRIRDYRAADRDACLAIFDSNVPRYFRPHERSDFLAFLDELPGPYLVVEDDDGRVTGCGGWALESDGRTAALCWGMVDRARHGRGIGSMLLRERLRRIEAHPTASAVILNTSQHTRGFYENLGFALRHLVADGYAPGLDRADMRLELPRRDRPAAGGETPDEETTAP